MAIKFPKMHVAASVVNRILNVHDDIQAHVADTTLPEPTLDPNPTDPMIEGAMLDVNLQQPSQAPVSAPDPNDSQSLLQQGILGDLFKR